MFTHSVVQGPTNLSNPVEFYFDALLITYLYSGYGRQPDNHESNENPQVQIHCIFDGSVTKTKNGLCSPNLIRAALLKPIRELPFRILPT